MKKLIICVLLTGCAPTIDSIKSIEDDRSVLLDRIQQLEKRELTEYFARINAEEALRKMEHKQSLDWPLPSCKQE